MIYSILSFRHREAISDAPKKQWHWIFPDVWRMSRLLKWRAIWWICQMVKSLEVTPTLVDVLQFVTGSASIPAAGFSDVPSLKFSHDQPGRKLHVSTRTNILTIPVSEESSYWEKERWNVRTIRHWLFAECKADYWWSKNKSRSRCNIHLQTCRRLKYRAHRYSNSVLMRYVFKIALNSRPCLQFQLSPEIHPSSPCGSCSANESQRRHKISRNFYLVVLINTSIATKLSDSFKTYQPESQILYYIALRIFQRNWKLSDDNYNQTKLSQNTHDPSHKNEEKPCWT